MSRRDVPLHAVFRPGTYHREPDHGFDVRALIEDRLKVRAQQHAERTRLWTHGLARWIDRWSIFAVDATKLGQMSELGLGALLHALASDLPTWPRA